MAPTPAVAALLTALLTTSAPAAGAGGPSGVGISSGAGSVPPGACDASGTGDGSLSSSPGGRRFQSPVQVVPWSGVLVNGMQWSGLRLSEHQQRLERSIREQSQQLTRLTSEALKGSLRQDPLSKIRLLQAPSFDAAEILAVASDRVAQLDEQLRSGVGQRLEEWLRSQKEWRRARALMNDDAVEDFSGAWRMQEVRPGRHTRRPLADCATASFFPRSVLPARTHTPSPTRALSPLPSPPGPSPTPSPLTPSRPARPQRYDMERFLERLGFNALQRAAVVRAGQVQVIAKKGDMLHIVTKDVRGSSELVLPIDGGPVPGQGDNKLPVNYRAFREGGALVITETAAATEPSAEREPLSVCRRTLQADGRMCIDVYKRTPQGDMVSMRVVFTNVDDGRARPAAGQPTAAKPQPVSAGRIGVGERQAEWAPAWAQLGRSLGRR